jgi:hypothetical protein
LASVFVVLIKIRVAFSFFTDEVLSLF